MLLSPYFEALTLSSGCCEDPESIIRTHEDYEEGIVKPYEALVKELRDGEKTMRRCVVLDTFAGIGTGIVVLKRLGIAIKKVCTSAPCLDNTWVHA